METQGKKARKADGVRLEIKFRGALSDGGEEDKACRKGTLIKKTGCLEGETN